MKKIVFIASTIVTTFLLSCGGDSSGTAGGMTDTEKKNLESAQAVAKMFETGDWSKVGDYIATDAVDHAGMTGDLKGLDAIKANFDQMGGMMGNFKNEVVKEIASGDYVYQWLKETATMKVDAMGMKAGTTNTMNMIETSKFKDGKIVEHWGFVDWADVSKMMPQGAPAGDMKMEPKKDPEGGKMDKK